MSNLRRKQLKDLVLLRGLTMESLVSRTGVPMASLMAMLSGTQDDKDKNPSLLLSQDTYQRILSLIGVDAHNTGLAGGMVREWRFDQKQSAKWREALEGLRKDLLSDQLVMVELHTARRLFGKQRRLLLVHDAVSNAQLVISGATQQLVGYLERVLGASSARRTVIGDKDFDMFASLIENGACRSSQFIAMLGGGKLKYNWEDVRAAAQQFDLQTDDLIVMIAEEVQRRASKTPVESDDAEFGGMRLVAVG